MSETTLIAQNDLEAARALAGAVVAGLNRVLLGQEQLTRHPQVDDQGLDPVVEGHEEELADPPGRAEGGAPEPLDQGLRRLPAHRPGADDGHRRHLPAGHLPLQTPADDLDLREFRH